MFLLLNEYIHAIKSHSTWLKQLWQSPGFPLAPKCLFYIWKNVQYITIFAVGSPYAMGCIHNSRSGCKSTSSILDGNQVLCCDGTHRYDVLGNENDESIVCMSVLY